MFDSKYPDEIPYMGVGHGKAIAVPDDLRQRIEEGSMIASTIEELGKKMKVPVETFKATVARYNELARLGRTWILASVLTG